MSSKGRTRAPAEFDIECMCILTYLRITLPAVRLAWVPIKFVLCF